MEGQPQPIDKTAPWSRARAAHFTSSASRKRCKSWQWFFVLRLNGYARYSTA